MRPLNCCTCAQIISQLVETCRAHDFTDIVIVHEHRGEPDGLVVCHLPYGPTAYFGVYNTVRLASTAPHPPSACLASLASLHTEHVWRGRPVQAERHALSSDALVEGDGTAGEGPTACTCVQVLRHDIGEKKKVGTISEAYPHLVIDNFTSKLGQRVGNILKFLFPCPKVSLACFLSCAATCGPLHACPAVLPSKATHNRPSWPARSFKHTK